jgi:hypothetical protein
MIRECELHIALGEKHIARQQKVVAELESDGAEMDRARRLLAIFEAVQIERERVRHRLRMRLVRLPR